MKNKLMEPEFLERKEFFKENFNIDLVSYISKDNTNIGFERGNFYKDMIYSYLLSK